MCRESSLAFEDLKAMNIGDALDYVYTWIEYHDPDRPKTRKATQEDLDRLY